MQKDFAAKASMVQQFVSREDRLLDVGCGKGHFVHYCADLGMRAEGIDISKSGVDFARTMLGITAHHGTLQSLRNELGLFDCVTLWATIEHVQNPRELLEEISALLKPGGYLFVDTGLGDDWLDRCLPGVNQWYDPPQHLYVFSACGLKILLEQTGFSIIRVQRAFDRTAIRYVVRGIRAACAAVSLRTVATFCRFHSGRFEFTRFPLGNLISITAQKRF
jgi:SAM-dependent methyltransferase